MKSRSHRRDPHIPKRKLKVEIMRKSREGVFDHNPLVTTAHAVECKTCGSLQKITYLEYLKTGRFELGETKTIEVAYAAPTLLGLNYIPESVTPLLIQIECRKCGAKILCCPASLEYLLFTARKQVKSNQFYV